MRNDQLTRDEKYSLLVLIVDRKQTKKVTEYAKKIHIKRFTSFRGRGTVQNAVWKLLELDDVAKEILIFVIPSISEDQIISAFSSKFQFSKPSHGILFTIKLSHVLGITYKAPQDQVPEPARNSGIVGVCAIVDKGRGDDVIDIVNRDLYVGGTILSANGSIDKSKKLFNLYVEEEKEVVLMLVPESKVRELSYRVADEMKFEKENTGILFTLAISQVKGLVATKNNLEDLGKKERQPDWSMEPKQYDALWTIVPSGQDQEVIEAAEKGGSQGGTIFHARGSHIRHHGPIIDDIEPRREVVMVVAESSHTEKIAYEIYEKFRLDDPGQGILFVFPIHETIGLTNQS